MKENKFLNQLIETKESEIGLLRNDLEIVNHDITAETIAIKIKELEAELKRYKDLKGGG